MKYQEEREKYRKELESLNSEEIMELAILGLITTKRLAKTIIKIINQMQEQKSPRE